MAIRIPIVADVAEFLRGAGDTVRSLLDVSDALDDVSRAGDVAGANVTAEVEAIGHAGDDSADMIRRSFTDAFDDVRRAGGTTGRRVRGDLDDTARHGRASLDEFSQEAKQNVAESLSSFRGDAESAVDAVQSTFGGLVSALGPAGVIGAAVAAAGVGLARGLWEKQQEAAEAFRERVTAIFDELRQNEGALSGAFKSDAIAELLSDAEALARIFGSADMTSIRGLFDDTRLSSAQLRTVWQGLTGDTSAVARAQDDLRAKLEDVRAQLLVPTLPPARRAELLAQVEAVNRLGDALDAAGDAGAEAAARAALYGDAVAGIGDVAGDAADAEAGYAGALAESAAAAERANDALRVNAGLKGDAVAAEIAMREAVEAVTDARRSNGKSLDLNTSKGRDNTKAVLDALDAINRWGDAQIAAGRRAGDVNRALTEQGDTLVHDVAKAFGMTKEEARKYIQTLGGIPKRIDTRVEVHAHGVAATKADLASIPDDLPVRVAPYVDTDALAQFRRRVQTYLDGTRYYVDVAPRPGKSVYRKD